MILTEKIEILINKKNINIYKKIGFNTIIGETIVVPIEKFSKGSSILIVVMCDYCQNVKKISYKNYNKSLKTGDKYACSQKCSYIKKSEILYKESGIKNIFQSEDVKRVIKENNLEKFGVTHHTQTKEFKEKFSTNNPMKKMEVKEKSRIKNLKRWNGIGFSSKLINEKIKNTNLEKWGTETPCELQSIKKIIKNTNLEKWGGTGYQSIEISKKINESVFKKWGTDSNTKSEDFRKIYYKLAQDSNYIEYLNGGISIFNCDVGHTFSIHKNNYLSRKENKNICTICNPIGETSSFKERELHDFIESLGIGFIKQWRDGLEIDIYLPDHRVGFEFNGLYFHSDFFKHKLYHIEKTKHFKERGIRIVHIWEDDWDHKKEIIKSQIKNILNLSTKIGARNCQVKTVSYKESKKFLDENHIQGSYSAIKESYGLYYKNELISIMCFDQFEGRKKMEQDEWNISRFCNKLDISIIGGASKLLNFFIKDKLPNRIISYADIDWSMGNLYEKLNFNKLYETNPDYMYIIKKKRVHKSRFRNSKTGVREKYLNIPKIWNCGKIKYEKFLKK